MIVVITVPIEKGRLSWFCSRPRLPAVVAPSVTPEGKVRRAALRLARGLSQEDLAGRANLSARYVSSIERAVVAASVTVLGQLADALRVDPRELIRNDRRKGR